MKTLSKMKVNELHELAVELDIDGVKMLTRTELITAIEAARSEDTPAGKDAAEAVDARAVVKSNFPKRHPFEDAAPSLPPLELGGIPIGYDREHLELKVQGPQTLFCYWSFRDDKGGDAQLSVYDVTDGQRNLVRSVQVDVSAGRWFIHDVGPDRAYVVTLELNAGGAVLKSTVSHTPPLTPSRVDDVAFVTLRLRGEDSAEGPHVIVDLRSIIALRPFVPPEDAYASEVEHGEVTQFSAGEPVVAGPAPASTFHPGPSSHAVGA
jgi:hypothetical protein